MIPSKRVSVKLPVKHGICLTNHSLWPYGHCAEGDCRGKMSTRTKANKLVNEKSQPAGWLFYTREIRKARVTAHLFVITANFLPDLITIGFHRLIITGLRCAQTLLIIQYAYTFLVGKLLMLFLFLQHV